MRKERARQLSSGTAGVAFSTASAAAEEDPGFWEDLDQLHRDAYTSDVSPRMDAALQSREDRDIRCAILKSVSWLRHVELLGTGLSGKFYKKAKKKITNFWRQGLDILVDNASRRCSKDHKPEEAIWLMSLARAQALFGTDSGSTAALEAAKRCAKLELEFDSESSWVGVSEFGTMTISMHVHAMVKIDPLATESPIGQAPVEYLTFSAVPSCGTTTIQSYTGSPFLVLSINLDLNQRVIGDCETDDKEGSFKVISVDIEPSTTTEDFTVICPPGAPVPISGSFWTGSFVVLHQQERSGPRSIRIAGFEQGSGSLLARWTSNRTKESIGVTVSAQTAINLWHRPE